MSNSNQMFLLLTFIYAAALSCVNGGNVLIRPFMGGGSHYMVAKVIAAELVNRGHSVTMVVQDRDEEQLRAAGEDKLFNFEFHRSNFTQEEFDYLLQNITDAGLKGKYMEHMVSLMGTGHMEKIASECDNLIGDVELVSRLRHSNFDVAIIDGSDQCPILQFLGGPYVVLLPSCSTVSPILFANRMPFNPSYVPEMVTGYDHRMSFVGRLKNTANAMFFAGFFKAFGSSLEELKARYERLSDVSLFFTNADLWLINTHFVLDFPRPLLPNTVTVGGLTTKDARPLAQVSAFMRM